MEEKFYILDKNFEAHEKKGMIDRENGIAYSLDNNKYTATDIYTGMAIVQADSFTECVDKVKNFKEKLEEIRGTEKFFIGFMKLKEAISKGTIEI